MRTIALLFLTTLSCFGQGFSDASAPFLLSTSSLRKGLVGYWRLEEASGTRYDCSSKGNHLTANNSPTNAVGKVQNALSCVHASAQYLSIADNTSISCGSGVLLTIAAWVNFTTVANNRGIFGKWGGTQNEYALEYAAITGSRFEFDLRDTSNTTTTSIVSTNAGAASPGAWYFVCAGYDGTNMWIQVNNASTEVKPYTGGVNDSDSSLYVGDYTTAHATTAIDGLVDEVGMWHRWLSPAERTFLYKSGKGTHFPWAHP